MTNRPLGEPVARLEGPLRWAIDLNRNASVAIEGPLRCRTERYGKCSTAMLISQHTCSSAFALQSLEPQQHSRVVLAALEVPHAVHERVLTRARLRRRVLHGRPAPQQAFKQLRFEESSGRARAYPSAARATLPPPAVAPPLSREISSPLAAADPQLRSSAPSPLDAVPLPLRPIHADQR